MVNKQVVAAAFVIGGTGAVRAWSNQQPLTPVLMGASVFALMLAILDLFGGPLAHLASGLALVAILYVLIDQFPWSTVLSLVGAKG